MQIQREISREPLKEIDVRSRLRKILGDASRNADRYLHFIECVIKRLVNDPTYTRTNSDCAEFIGYVPPNRITENIITSYVETGNTRNAPVEIERVETAFARRARVSSTSVR